ncbi:MAG: hypothetical protein AAF571_02030 [Verrucomicrobiota bacterium]
MKLLYKVLTFIILAPVLSIVLFIGIFIVGLFLTGVFVGYNNPDSAYELGAETGEKFVENYAGWLLLGSILFASLISGLVVVFELPPWCRDLNSADLPPEPQESLSPTNPKHSALGIASCILSILSGIYIVSLILIAGVIGVSTGGELREDSPVALLIGLFFLAWFFIQFFAFGLGIAAIFQPNTKKIFSIIGLCITVCLTLIAIGIFLLGSLA